MDYFGAGEATEGEGASQRELEEWKIRSSRIVLHNVSHKV